MTQQVNNTVAAEVSPNQAEFDAKYITAAEICQRVGISRPALQNGKRKLPAPIVIPGSQNQLWIRAEVEEIINAWAIMNKARPSNKNGAAA